MESQQGTELDVSSDFSVQSRESRLKHGVPYGATLSSVFVQPIRVDSQTNCSAPSSAALASNMQCSAEKWLFALRLRSHALRVQTWEGVSPDRGAASGRLRMWPLAGRVAPRPLAVT